MHSPKSNVKSPKMGVDVGNTGSLSPGRDNGMRKPMREEDPERVRHMRNMGAVD